MAEEYASNFSTEPILNSIFNHAEFEWNAYFIIFTALTLLLTTFSVIFGLGNIATIDFSFKQKHFKRTFNIYVCAMAFGDLINSNLVAVMDTYDLLELIISNEKLHKRGGTWWCSIKVISKFIFYLYPIQIIL